METIAKNREPLTAFELQGYLNSVAVCAGCSTFPHTLSLSYMMAYLAMSYQAHYSMDFDKHRPVDEVFQLLGPEGNKCPVVLTQDWRTGCPVWYPVHFHPSLLDHYERVMSAMGCKRLPLWDYRIFSTPGVGSNGFFDFKHWLKHSTDFDMISHFFGQKSRRVTYRAEPLTIELWQRILPGLIGFEYEKSVNQGFISQMLLPMCQSWVMLAEEVGTNRLLGAYCYNIFGSHLMSSYIFFDRDPEWKPYSLLMGLHFAIVRDHPNMLKYHWGINKDDEGDYKKHMLGTTIREFYAYEAHIED